MLLDKPQTLTSAKPLGMGAYMREVLKHRHLLWVFAAQEIKATYAQTYLGIAWAVIRPLFILSIFTIIFKFLLHVQTQSPYPLFAFAGMMAWNFFAQLATTGATAVTQKQTLVRKMYFPKIILPLSKILVVGLEMAVSLVLFFLFMAFERFPLSPCIITLPLFILLNISSGFTVAVWMNALNIRFQDLNQIVPSIIGIGIWITPVFYPTTIIPKKYECFVYANPMAGIIKGYRFALLGESFPEWQYWIPFFTILALMLAGIWYLSRVEDKIVDYV